MRTERTTVRRSGARRTLSSAHGSTCRRPGWAMRLSPMLVLVLFSVGPLAVAWRNWSRQSRLIEQADRTQATVVTFKVLEKPATGRVPVFQYSLDGETFRWNPSHSRKSPLYRKNDVVDVYVLRQDRSVILIDDFYNRWGSNSLLVGFSAISSYLSFRFLQVLMATRRV
ncbi:MAG: DUF3592 domain-containing protein [Planctomycetota bacterium]